MYRNYSYNPNINGQERFIGPLLPFIGGALVGYVVGRPNNYGYYQPYYPMYYSYPSYPYYYQANTYNLN